MDGGQRHLDHRAVGVEMAGRIGPSRGVALEKGGAIGIFPGEFRFVTAEVAMSSNNGGFLPAGLAIANAWLPPQLTDTAPVGAIEPFGPAEAVIV